MVLVIALLTMLVQDQSVTARELERIERQLAATWKAGDCAGWSALLAPDWSVTHISGNVITKTQALDMCKAPRPAGMEFALDDLAVRAYGDAAVVTGRASVTTGPPTPTSLTLRFTDVFIRRDGRWLVVASHATRRFVTLVAATAMRYFDDARLRAKRRKSRWNLLLIPAIAIPWFAAWWYTVIAMAHAYRFVHPGGPDSFPFWDSRNFRLVPNSIGGFFLTMGPLFAWLPVAMVVGNVLVHIVAPARRALDREAAAVPGTDYRSAHRALLGFASVLFPVGMFLSVLGLFL